MGAVPVAVAGRVGVDLTANDGVVGVEERLAADQLVVALEHVDGRRQRVVTEVARPRVTARLRRRITERGVVSE